MNEDQGFSLIKLKYLLGQKMHTKFEYIEIHVGVWAPFLNAGTEASTRWKSRQSKEKEIVPNFM